MRRGALALAALSLLAGPAAALARPAIAITAGWARPAPAGMNTAGYFTLVNRGPADRLDAAASPLAASVAPHVSRLAGGLMTMRPLAFVPIPAHATVTFAPGGMHLMIEGLKQPLRRGDRLAVVLRFARAGPVSVTLRVH